MQENNKIIIYPSVERCLIAINDNSDRVKRLKKQLSGIDIDVFQARHEEHVRLQEILRKIFGETDYANKISEIQDMMETARAPKIIYLNSLRRFGKKQGLEIYRQIKPMLYQNAA